MAGQKILVIGDEDAVFGLGLVGLEGRVVASMEDARKAVRDALADPENALILLTENFSEARPETMEGDGPLVVEIPGKGPARTSAALEAQIERALGTHLER
jgi:V/A-type H+-transporting ATPase subunit F